MPGEPDRGGRGSKFRFTCSLKRDGKIHTFDNMRNPRRRRGLALLQNLHTSINIALVNNTTINIAENNLALIRELRDV